MQNGDWRKEISAVGFDGSQPLSHTEKKAKDEMGRGRKS